MDKTSKELDIQIYKYLFCESRTQTFNRFADQNSNILGTKNSVLRKRAVNRKNYLRTSFLSTPDDIISQIKICGLLDLARIVEGQKEEYQDFHHQQAIDSIKRATPTKETPAIVTPSKTTPSKSNYCKIPPTPKTTPSKHNSIVKTTTPSNRVPCRRFETSEESEDDSIESTKTSTKKSKRQGTMSISSHSSVPVSEEYELNLNAPEMNPGILPLLCPEVVVSDSGVVCDKLFIKVINVDIADWVGKLHSAKLTQDFTGIEITLPRLPHYERNREDVDKSLKLSEANQSNAPAEKKAHYWYCPKVHLQSLKLVTNCESKDYMVRKTVLFSFPRGMKCNNRYFGKNHDNPFKLTPKIYIQHRGGKYPMQFYCVVYEMAVEGTVARYGQLEDEDEDENILDELIAGVQTGMAIYGNNGMSND